MIPKISIITPSYNQGMFIEKTIDSVLSQNYLNLEYMIIDGGSKDDTVPIIKKYEKYLTYWVSEKDNGQTHAINKGFRRAKGVLVNWINSDDMLARDALKNLAAAYTRHPDADVFFGDYQAVDEKGDLIYSRKSSPYLPFSLYWGRQLSSQPAVFFKRNLLLSHGYLNENNQFCMDTEFWIRIAHNGALFHQIKQPLGITRAHGDAKTTRMQEVLHNEHKDIVRSYGSLGNFQPGSWLENIYFTGMNRFWRSMSALCRLGFRGDVSFNKASQVLQTLSQES